MHAENGSRYPESYPGLPEDPLGGLLRSREAGTSAPLKCVFIYAHPDDEAVGSSVLLPVPEDALFVSVTDGSPRNGSDAADMGFASWQDYAEERRKEWFVALSRSGNDPEKSLFLGYPDQEATYFLTEITLRLIEIFRTFHPSVVMTHPYEGGHPDHDAVSFSVRSACRWLESAGHESPHILESAFYHAGPAGMVTHEFLPTASEAHPEDCRRIELTGAESEKKRMLFSCYGSQRKTLSYFPVSTECYRYARKTDFSVRPHAGTLHYENYPWGMTGDRFRKLAVETSTELGTGTVV